MFDKAFVWQNYVNSFATGFVFGMAFMAVAVICFVSTVRHLMGQSKSGPIGSQDPQQPITLP